MQRVNPFVPSLQSPWIYPPIRGPLRMTVANHDLNVMIQDPL
jgi:hypothetical protein